MTGLSLEDIRQAAVRISPYVRRTPMDRSTTYSTMTGNEVFLKLENLQKTGSFKVRGALNRLLTLPQEKLEKGVITASAGNHAQGVAYAASVVGVRALVVMPLWANEAKVNATKAYGAEVLLRGSGFDEAAGEARKLAEQTGMTYVPAFDDDMVIAGQGTLGLEILEEVPDLDAVIVPIGGGGLISGIALAVKSLRPQASIIGVESVAFPAVKELLAGRQPSYGATIADGIAVKMPSERTLGYIRKNVDRIDVVDDDAIAKAMLLLLERAKIVSEPAGAAALASLLYSDLGLKGKKVAVLVSGGNVDMHLLSRVIERSLMLFSRELVVSFRVADRPGMLASALNLVASEGGNVLHVQHDREARDVPLGYTRIRLILEVSNEEAKDRIVAALASAFLDVKEGARNTQTGLFLAGKATLYTMVLPKRARSVAPPCMCPWTQMSAFPSIRSVSNSGKPISGHIFSLSPIMVAEVGE